MAEIAFDLEAGAEPIGDLLTILQVAVELLKERAFRHIGDVRGHAGHSKTFHWPSAMGLVSAAMPIGISLDGLATNLMKGDVLC